MLTYTFPKHAFLIILAFIVPCGVIAKVLPDIEAAVTSHECITCHADHFGDESKYKHFPAADGSCDSCHEATPKHLAGSAPAEVTTEKSAENCYDCHDRKDEGSILHAALKDDDSCVKCHNSHGSNQPFFIREDSVAQLCTACHKDVPIEGKSVHTVGKEGRGCANCHEPHSSEFDKLLHSDSEDFCLNCHDKKIQTKEAKKPRVIPNIKEMVKDFANVHPPAEDGCNDCHTPHASKNSRLLREHYSLKDYNRYSSGGWFGEPNTYALCFGCHDTEMLSRKIGEDETGFRKDTVTGRGTVLRKNLHWFHVVDAGGRENKEKGRSCNLCHSPHGSPQAFLIRPFWMMGKHPIKIKFTELEDGGACSTCHHKADEKHQYRRITE